MRPDVTRREDQPAAAGPANAPDPTAPLPVSAAPEAPRAGLTDGPRRGEGGLTQADPRQDGWTATGACVPAGLPTDPALPAPTLPGYEILGETNSVGRPCIRQPRLGSVGCELLLPDQRTQFQSTAYSVSPELQYTKSLKPWALMRRPASRGSLKSRASLEACRA